MKRFTLYLFLFITIPQLLHAQVVTQVWATLANNAIPNVFSVAIDASGNVYTANNGNNNVSKITAGGTVTQAWATLASVAHPYGIAIDASGNVYTANNGKNTVSKITADGTVTQAWATLAGFASPFGIAIDASGNVYTSNNYNSTVSKITATGTVTQAWASLASGASPYGIAIDASGNVYTSNYYNSTVSKITAGGTVTQAWASLASGANPTGIAIDASGNVYTSNYGNNTVSKITALGTVTQAWASLASGASSYGIAIDASGNVYTSNYGNNTVSKITATGTVTQAWASLASGAKPIGIDIDASGNVYTSNNNNTVSKVTTVYTWVGGTNTIWATASNWNQGTVPISSSIVEIPSTTNKPTISVAGAVASNITINNGAVLTLSGTGTLNASNGITVNAGGALVGNSSNVTGTLTLQQSIIGQRGFRMLANPFTTAQTIATVATNNGITINSTSQASGQTDARTFSNSTNAWSNVTGTTLAANTPYALFIRGLATEVNGLTYTGGPTAFTYKVSGTLNGASTSVTPSSSSNFMLVGNPYAAPVNTQAFTGGTSTSYYTYQIAQGATTTDKRTKAGSWVVALSSSTTSTVPVLGVVAYQPASTSSFNITAADINTGGTLQTGLFRNSDAAITNLELDVEQAGAFQDKMFIRLDSKAEANGKDKLDMAKFWNDNVNLYTRSADSLYMAVDARASISNVPVGISGLAGDYNFKVANNNFPVGSTIMLEDKYLNTFTELKTGTTYSFTINSDAASKGEKRFVLNFMQKAIAPVAAAFSVKVLGNPVHGNTVMVQLTGVEAAATITIVDMAGRVLKTVNAVNGINAVDIGKPSGTYLLKVGNGSNTVTEKVICN